MVIYTRPSRGLSSHFCVVNYLVFMMALYMISSDLFAATFGHITTRN